MNQLPYDMPVVGEDAAGRASAAQGKPRVSVIPPTRRAVESGGQIKKQKNLRVAAYCRVSTGDESQQTSYTTQKRFYTELITGRPGWSLAGIYADEAISGTSRAHRIQFNAMIEDAVQGKMDYIVTKSISRFARNTVDTLGCVRQLRQLSPPVGIYFEKENIDTLDATGELILTILSALAQDESRSISDNIRWSIQRKFQNGEAVVDLGRMLGYEKGGGGEWRINEAQAETVRFIFKQYVCGASANQIAKRLNERGVRTARNSIWRADSVLYILRNEKYVGDCEMQKTITKSFLTHAASPNNGEAPRYYVRDHHAGIIDRATWDKAQSMLASAGTRSGGDGENAGMEGGKRRSPNESPFHNLICGAIIDGKVCGAPYRRYSYSAGAAGYADARCLAAERGAMLARGDDPDAYWERYCFHYAVLRCKRNGGGKRTKEEMACPSGAICEFALEQSFMEMLYRLKRGLEEKGEESELMKQFREVCRRADACDTNIHASQQRIMIERQLRDLRERLDGAVRKQTDAMRRAAIERSADPRADAFIPDPGNGMTGAGGDARRQEDAGTIVPGRMSDAFSEFSVFSARRTERIHISDYPEVRTYAELADDIRARIDALEKEREELVERQSASASLRKNFEIFLLCLRELPEVNAAGMKLNVNGLDAAQRAIPEKRGDAGCAEGMEERIGRAPDILKFEKGMYLAFVKRGEVDGDVVTYETNFGMRLASAGNARTLESFIGCRRANADGVQLLDELWKVPGTKIAYHRRLKTSGPSKKGGAETNKTK